MDGALRKVGVSLITQFYPTDHPARLARESQFYTDTTEDQTAISQSVSLLASLPR